MAKNLGFSIVFVVFFSMSVLGAVSFPSEQIKALCGVDTQLVNCSSVTLSEISGFSAEQFKRIYKHIDNSMDIWGDTILEGDYTTDYKDVKIESFQTMRTPSGTVLGYRVSFSVSGWETSTCTNENYDSSKPETMENCTQGRIKQVIYLTPDLKEYETSEENFENPFFLKN